jgi:hypothetical protein
MVFAARDRNRSATDDGPSCSAVSRPPTRLVGVCPAGPYGGPGPPPGPLPGPRPARDSRRPPPRPPVRPPRARGEASRAIRPGRLRGVTLAGGGDRKERKRHVFPPRRRFAQTPGSLMLGCGLKNQPARWSSSNFGSFLSTSSANSWTSPGSSRTCPPRARTTSKTP